MPDGLIWTLADLADAESTLDTTWPQAVPTHWTEGTGAGVRVCLLDSGVEPGHELVGPLDGAYAVATGEDGRPHLTRDRTGDTAGHGTACAGIIRSLAPGCSLVSVRILGTGFSGRGDALVAGLRWAVDQGFDIINLSLSTTRAEFADDLRQLADRASFRRTLLVAAAHNRRVESFPWRFSSVLSVGSHALPDPRRILYNPTPPVEFFARGVGVRAAWLGGSVRDCTGNSFAAAHLTGLCALLLGRYPGLTPFQVRTYLHLMAGNVRPPAATAGPAGPH